MIFDVNYLKAVTTITKQVNSNNMISSMRFFGLSLGLSVSMALFSTVASAKVFEVKDIDIEGLQRISAGKVFASFPVTVGDLVDDEALRSAARTLFKTGNFEDIAFLEDNGRLILRLKERPVVDSITIDGSKKIPEEELLSNLRDSGLAEGQIFKRDILEGMAQALKNEYAKNGLYGSTVNTRIQSLPRNRVAVYMDIAEGSVASIKYMNIVGNENFSEKQLREDFELTTTNWLSWIRKDDKYNKEKLSGDLERLESYYKDRGYLQYKVNSTQVSVSPDKSSVFITINIDEGDIYKISEVAFSGELVVPEEELRQLNVSRVGSTYSQALINWSTDLMTSRLGNDGYTFAEVNAVPEINEEDTTAKVTFVLDPKKRVYVRRINISGNTKTADDVARREMRQMEGAVASNSRIESGKILLERTAFVKRGTVEVETPEVPAVDDQIDVNYTFEEQASGQVGAQFGYSQTSGLQLGGNLSESNFFGTGKQVGFALNTNDFQKSISISYTDPYFTVDGVSAGFSIFARESDFSRFNLSSFNTENIGARFNFGYPLSNFQRLEYGFGYEVQKLGASTRSPDVLKFINDNGADSNIFTLNLGWRESTLNSPLFATSGAQQSLGIELSPPGASDLSYYRITYSGQKYFPLGGFSRLLNRWSFRMRAELGYGGGLGDTERLPFYKNFYGGGFGSIRGFERNSLGPRSQRGLTLIDAGPDLDELAEIVSNTDPNDIMFDSFGLNDTDPFGGNTQVELSAEIIFPLPFLKDQTQVQSSFFFDAGNIFDTECGSADVFVSPFPNPPSIFSGNEVTTNVIALAPQINCSKPDVSELRYSFGVSVQFITGFGPISLSISKPYNAGPFDEDESFQFSLGNQF